MKNINHIIKYLFVILITALSSPAINAITIGVVSNKMNVEIHLKDGKTVCGETKMPKENQDKLKIKCADRDTVILSQDVNYMSVWSSKYDRGKKYIMRWSEYYKKPGGKIHKPAWIILRQEGPYCDMWCIARKANFGLDGDIVMWHKYDETTIELYWKKTETHPTMMVSLKHCQEYFSDDKVITHKIETQTNPPFYMEEQVQEYVPGRE